MYIFLVAPPGVGKTLVTNQVRQLWSSLDNASDTGLRVGSQSLTGAALIDELRDASRRVYPPGELLESVRFHSLACSINELGVFLPAYEPTMMNNLTDIFDGHTYSERRRWAKSTSDEKGFKIDAPQINLLTATQPGYLTNFLPEGAWDMGFLSRVLLIFNSERTIAPLFQPRSGTTTTMGELTSDLAHIFTLYGEMRFTEEAKAALIAWHAAGGPPIPDHPRLQNYVTRRTTHALKLSMIASAACRDDCVIGIEEWNRALSWLIEAEEIMPDIFKAMVVDSTVKAMDECWHYCAQLYMKEKKPIAQYRVVEFLKQRVPVQNVFNVLKVMESARLLEETMEADVGVCYKPKPRR